MAEQDLMMIMNSTLFDKSGRKLRMELIPAGGYKKK
jgi:hypothetical protein